ncbi:hypothetical protein BGP75_23435 [Motiliproteus sp. MSK22-1]|nr:hypothetical protein BGP75_23435 [Motiliproteus sp. MSK22-1]
MIALCPHHHNQADGGLWSNEQLRIMKKSPFVDDVLRVQWPWQPESLVIKVGASLVVGSGSPFRLDGLPVLHFYPEEIEDLGISTVTFDSDIRDANRKSWLKIKDSYFDLRLKNTTNVIFSAQTKTFLAKHNDNTYISLRFKKYTFGEYKAWLESFMPNPEIAVSAYNSTEKVGAVDSDGNVSVILFEGCFKTHKVGLSVKKDKIHFESYLPGRFESFEMGTTIVSAEHRAIMRMHNGPEFFSLG